MSRSVFVPGDSAIAETIREVVSCREGLDLITDDTDAEKKADLVIDTVRPGGDLESRLVGLEAHLSSGRNVICCFDLLFPAARGEVVLERLHSACLRGSSTLLGLGFDGTWFGAELMLTLTSLCRHIDLLSIERAVTFDTCDELDYLGDTFGFGLEVDEFAVREDRYRQLAQNVVEEQVALIASALGFEAARCDVSVEPWFAPTAMQVCSGEVAAGGLAAVCWHGSVVLDGSERITLDTVFRGCRDAAPEWQQQGVNIQVQGEPELMLSLDEQFVSNDRLAAAMRAVNAALPVCVATTGVKTILDLPGLWGYGTFGPVIHHE